VVLQSGTVNINNGQYADPAVPFGAARPGLLKDRGIAGASLTLIAVGAFNAAHRQRPRCRAR